MKVTTVSKESAAYTAAATQMQQLYEQNKGKPQHTPKEIEALYGLHSDPERYNLTKIAKDGTPEGMHIWKLLNFVATLRSASYTENMKEGPLSALHKIYPEASKSQLNDYFRQIVMLWVLPTKTISAIIEKKQKEADSHSHGGKYPYLTDIWGSLEDPETKDNYRQLSLPWIQAKGKKLLKRQQELDSQPITKVSAELGCVIEALYAVELIEYALEGDYDGLWDAISETYSGNQLAIEWMDYMKIFYKG